MTRQDPEYRSTEESNDLKHTFTSETGIAKMGWSGHKNDLRATTKETENFRWESTSKVTRKDALTASLKVAFYS